MAPIPQRTPTSGDPATTTPPVAGSPGADAGTTSPGPDNVQGAQAAGGLGTQPGLQVAYFAFKVGGEQGRAVGLFRIADDQDAQVLTMERFTPDGEWVDDPKLIDDLHEPGVFSVDDGEAQSIQQDLLALTPQA